MKRTRSHKTDDRAIAFFLTHRPIEWAANDLQKPDYGKDYLLEVSETGDLTGENFFIQLKGTDAPALSTDSKFISYSLEQKHALYYADKQRLPVFLVLIDLKNNQGYWLFVQKHLLEDLKGKRWRSRKSVVVRLPTENRLDDHARFLEAVKAAREYMAALYPTSIQHAITGHKKYLESLDPRLDIQIVATDKQAMYWLIPKEDITLSVSFTGEPNETVRKLEDLIGKGIPLEFKAGEMQVTGSALFEMVCKQGGVLESAVQIDAHFRLATFDASGSEIGRLDSIPVLGKGGTQEMRLDGEFPDSAFSVKATFRPDEKEVLLGMGLWPAKWFGQPILYLAHFDVIHAFLRTVETCASIGFQWSVKGNLVAEGKFAGDCRTLVAHFADVTSLLDKARVVARHYQVNPAFPSNFNRSHIGEIEWLYELFQNGTVRRPVREKQLSFKLAKPHWQTVKEIVEHNMTHMQLVHPGMQMSFLETRLQLGDISDNFTHVKVDEEQVEKLKAHLANRDENLEFVVMPQPGCERVFAPFTMLPPASAF